MIDPREQDGDLHRQKNGDGWPLLFGCWLIASVATLGSLVLDKALGMEPCSMCWYQRIFMYPLVPVLLTGLLPLERSVVRYALPLAIFGWITAFYHFLMMVGVVPESLQPCGRGPSCVEDELELFGIVNIPMLSLLSFTAVIALLIAFFKRTKQ
jgi:disulfide bond formation protein DsbB